MSLRTLNFGPLLITLALGATAANATVIAPADYDFPYKDPYQATLISALLKGGNRFKPEVGTLTNLQPNRDKIPYVEGRNQLVYEFHIASPNAPLVVILAGLGGSANGGTSEFIADRLGRAGFSTISLPSPYFWQYALAASKTGIPGIATDDAKEIYGQIKMVLNHLAITRDVHPRSLGFVGFSMGAFEGVFIAEIDRQQNELGIQKFVLINPPMDLTHGIHMLDSMYLHGLSLGKSAIDGFMSIVLGNGKALRARDIDSPDYFVGLEEKLGLPDEGAKFLASENLESVAPDLVMVSQSIHQTLPSSVLTAPASPANQTLRESEAQRFTLGDYMKSLVVPSFLAISGMDPGRQDIPPSLRTELSLREHLAEIASDDRLNFMHNEDDFITDPNDLAALEQTVPNRTMVYPYGGHVENIWYPENLKHMLDVFESLK
ncbi:MAG: hypothetical protein P4M08_04890 [Oligoflexia bacterium]|nr:hypothetical protein [Oligoflexia bacterium]